MTKETDIFARNEAQPATAEQNRREKWRLLTASLSKNEDFKEWLYEVLCQLGYFAREEGPRSDFGYGIRASADRIRTSLLQTEEGATLLGELAKREYLESFKNIQKELTKENQNAD